MPRAYSNDLRRKVVAHVEQGNSCRRTAALFQVSVSFVIKLMQRVRCRGDVSPDQIGGYKTTVLAEHEAWIRARVAETSEITLAELVEGLAEKGVASSPAAMARYLIRLGLTRKKRPPLRRSASVRTS